MNAPLISVIIPAYNQAAFIGRTIQSVLHQTFQDFEIIVVDDHSPDETGKAVRQFSDPRVKYLVHLENLAVSAARNTGMRYSSGAIIALLDADDRFHPDKLRAHVDFLDAHPEAGVSYNSRFELNHSSETIRELSRARSPVGLADVLIGFPFSPSDMVVRREWAFKVGLFDPEMRTAEDTDFPCRLALAGCRFGRIDRALNYRRHHSGRHRWNLQGRIEDVRRAQSAVFADPRCPEEILAMRPSALKLHLLEIVAVALVQEETGTAIRYLNELISVDASIVEGSPSPLIRYLLSTSINDESVDHAALLHKMLSQLPPGVCSASDLDWAVKRGWLWKAVRSTIWGGSEAGEAPFSHALKLHACIEDDLPEQITSQLLGCKNELGEEAAGEALTRLCSQLGRFSRRAGEKLKASYMINRAFEDYRLGDRKSTLGLVMAALQNDPSYIANRGVISMFVRSLIEAGT